MVSALDFQAGYLGFESRSGQDNFQTISTSSSYSTCPGLIDGPWVENKVGREALGDRQRHQVCKDVP